MEKNAVACVRVFSVDKLLSRESANTSEEPLVPLSIIRRLVQVDPQVVEKHYFLHFILQEPRVFRHFSHEDLIKIFVELCPRAARIPSCVNGQLPIQIFMRSRSDMTNYGCLDAIYEAFPDGLK